MPVLSWPGKLGANTSSSLMMIMLLSSFALIGSLTPATG
ncbi:hypothetical protein ykris0001_46790 [Yersinia kristensenii ATCC 33638]|nr:hypothetical protein ykris0001_46790 [Yersinia kristensenii ATCC 33638]